MLVFTKSDAVCIYAQLVSLFRYLLFYLESALQNVHFGCLRRRENLGSRLLPRGQHRMQHVINPTD